MEQRVITVEGMSCGHCKAAVERAVLALPGVIAATVNLEEKKLALDYDNSRVTLVQIASAIEEEGYTVVSR
ncbi:cation transporter [Propionispora hippei]|uniref:Copper chaperone CopZ n=1 Tax=Propionispora hippei DSM 15287 TaxID=1123003 RepID=A0A1M6MRS2_9FIRM|nr:cation transporter [Propionispora hippei]SHJ86208.1 copper chaperone [Propionispora hippei DSM 15287]